jgi:hypothetical protein
MEITIQSQALACNAVPNSGAATREFLLAEIRCLALHARLTATELDSVGTALRGGLISPDCAAAWLIDLGLIDCIRVPRVGP